MKRKEFYKMATIGKCPTIETVYNVLSNIEIKNHGSAWDWYQVKTTDRNKPIHINGYTFYAGDPCSNGNAKIAKGTLCSTILPIVTCPGCASCLEKCYALKAVLVHPTVLIHHLLYTILAMSNPHLYLEMIKNQIRKSNCKIVRIHESGDFFNQEYVNEWAACMREFPNVEFFTYTKTDFFINEPNFNLIPSKVLWHGKKVNNFAPVAIIKQMSRDLHAPICPCGFNEKTGKNNQVKICTSKCRLCIDKPLVLFVEH